MDLEIISEFTRRLPAKRKTTPGGWTSFNAVCCHHRGHAPERRGRGGIKFDSGAVIYSCFNCGFKAVWTPGQPFSKNIKLLLGYMGATQDEIAKINFYAGRTQAERFEEVKASPGETVKIVLPPKTKPLEDWAETPNDDFEKVVKYLVDRNPNLFHWHEFYWTDNKKFLLNPETTIYGMHRRLIIPFKHPGSTWLYGYSARSIDSLSHAKYITFTTPGYLFGQYHLYDKYRKYAICCEGIFDAISISGVAWMKQTISPKQLETLINSDKKIIIVPDRDKDGHQVIEQAIKHKFSVAFPEWQRGIKDTADAVSKYGRLAALQQILESIESDPFKIQLKEKFWFNDSVKEKYG